MSISTESRLWLATHLLYPNSSQAYDVYQSLILQSEDSIKDNNVNLLFRKLYQIIDKIPAVSSNKSFHVFENANTEFWQQIFKKAQKEQLIIFIGFFVFQLKIKDISNLLKLTNERVLFLLHQIFKNSYLVTVKSETQNKIKLKKINEVKVSFLYTNENLIDYCLNLLMPDEVIKVEQGLSLYPELQYAKLQYDQIIKEVNTLIQNQSSLMNEPLIETSETLSEPSLNLSFKNKILTNKKTIGFGLLSVLFLIFTIIRPNWIYKLSKDTKDHFIVLQEFEPKKIVKQTIETSTEVQNTESASSEKMDIKLTDKTPTVKNSQSLVVNNPKTNLSGNTADTINIKELKETNKLAKDKNTATDELVKNPSDEKLKVDKFVNKTKSEKNNQEAIKKIGGLYRGSLIVNEINNASEKLTEKIVSMGGKKAGEVELGWRKSEKMSYYHFALPEDNVDNLKEFVGGLGELQIQFENHPRLMPAGVKRFILEVKLRD